MPNVKLVCDLANLRRLIIGAQIPDGHIFKLGELCPGYLDRAILGGRTYFYRPLASINRMAGTVRELLEKAYTIDWLHRFSPIEHNRMPVFGG